MMLMIKNNEKQIIDNLENVVRHLLNDRTFTVLVKNRKICFELIFDFF